MIIPFLLPGSAWAPKDQTQRLIKYHILEAYYRREAIDLLQTKNNKPSEMILQLPNLISRAYASLLFGESIKISFNENEMAQEKWNEIDDESEFDSLNFEQGFISSAMGDCFYKIIKQDDKVSIGMIPGSIVFAYSDRKSVV